MQDQLNILRLDASASPEVSASRRLGDRLLEELGRPGTRIELRHRDLNQGLSFIASC